MRLREDLRLLVMSATLDVGALRSVLGGQTTQYRYGGGGMGPPGQGFTGPPGQDPDLAAAAMGAASRDGRGVTLASWVGG